MTAKVKKLQMRHKHTLSVVSVSVKALLNIISNSPVGSSGETSA